MSDWDSTAFASDPRVLYDPAHDRWIATLFAGTCNGGALFIAVSDGGDPTGTWQQALPGLQPPMARLPHARLLLDAGRHRRQPVRRDLRLRRIGGGGRLRRGEPPRDGLGRSHRRRRPDRAIDRPGSRRLHLRPGCRADRRGCDPRGRGPRRRHADHRERRLHEHQRQRGRGRPRRRGAGQPDRAPRAQAPAAADARRRRRPDRRPAQRARPAAHGRRSGGEDGSSSRPRRPACAAAAAGPAPA